MVTLDFIPFFTTMAAVGATLFGLIFVVISIRPEVAQAQTASVIRQVQVAASYSALLNPLVISLLALPPHATIENITVIMSAIGLANTLIMGSFLVRDSRSRVRSWKSALFLLGGLVIYGFEMFYGIGLAVAPGDSATLSDLTVLLVIIYIYGVARAWDLVGVRQFHIQEVLGPLIGKGRDESAADA